MKIITYSLLQDNKNSNDYYEVVDIVSKNIISSILKEGKEYIEKFSCYINTNSIEEVRSKEEYGIEIILIGVLIEEYKENSYAFNKKYFRIFKYLNIHRKNSKFKKKIDYLRGKLATKILINKKQKHKRFNLEDYKSLILWLDATGDFKEELYRMSNWLNFLKDETENFSEVFFEYCIDISKSLKVKGEKYFDKYLVNVDEYLKNYYKDHLGKEDIIYCGKGKIQYYFNIVSSEIMNRVYRNDFLKCNVKKVFAPACMRQTKSKCLSRKVKDGYECSNCSLGCNVNKLSLIGKKNNFEVFVIPHETALFNGDFNKNHKIGIIGIACILNLMSGGWKALRLGFKPQCVVLEYCGCKTHWFNEGIMTSIDNKRIRYIIE